jgi:16S rRNA processing protein RimM
VLEVGTIVKPHGLGGEVVVSFVSNRPERVMPGAVLLTDGGSLEVKSARPFQHRWLVRFIGVDTNEAAEALRGRTLFGHPIEDDEAWWVHDLVGSAVVDAGTGQILGRVRSVVANPASDLLELDTSELVPLRFVVERAPGRVMVELPPGLLDRSRS